jgi:hypothetical protein
VIGVGPSSSTYLVSPSPRAVAQPLYYLPDEFGRRLALEGHRFVVVSAVRPLLIAGVPFDVRVRFVVPATVEGLVAVVKD